MQPPIGPDSTSDRPAGGGALGRQHAAVRAHHEQRAVEALLLQVVLEPADVGRDLRADEGVGGDRRGALVFVPFARERGAGRHEQIRGHLLQQGRGPLLVRRVGVGVHEEHRDRLDARVLSRRATAASSASSSGVITSPAALDALVDLEPELARDQRLVAEEREIERIGPVAARDLQHVAEPAVVTSAVRAPRRWTSELITSVVP